MRNLLQALGACSIVFVLAAVPAAAEIPITGKLEIHDPDAAAGAVVTLHPGSSEYEDAARWLRGEADEPPVAVVWPAADGSFEIVAPGPGLWKVVVSVPGLATWTRHLRPLYRPVELPTLQSGTVWSSSRDTWRRSYERLLPPDEAEPSERRAVRVLDAAGRSVSEGVVLAGLRAGFLDADGSFAAAGPVPSFLRILTPDGNVKELHLGRDAAWPLELRLDPPVHASGRVVASGTGEPIADAWVWYNGAVTTTGPGGDFELVAPADAGGRSPRLRTTKEGYAVAQPRSWKDTAGVTLRLPALAVFEGQVVDADGQPLAGVEIEGEPEGSSEVSWMELDRLRTAEARSGDDGGFRLSELVAGSHQYALRLSKDGYATGRHKLPALRPFERLSDVVVLERTRRVFGRVVDADEAPIEGALARLVPHLNSGVPVEYVVERWGKEGTVATADAEGLFFAEAGPGEHVLRVEAQGFLSLTVPGLRIDKGGTGDVDLRTVVLEEGAVLHGRVLDAAGRGVEEADVWRLEDTSQGSYGHVTKTDADGSFTISELRPGEELAFGVSKAGFVPRALEVTVPLAEGLEVVLDSAARVSGRVVDGAGLPVEGAYVSANREDLPPFRPSFVRHSPPKTDEEGRFALRLEPGRFKLSTSAKDSGEASQTLVVKAGEEAAEVILVLQPEEQKIVVEGRVTHADGTPVAQGHVMTVDNGGGSVTDGTYQVRLRKPGRTTIWAGEGGLRSPDKEVEARPGTTTVDLVLAEGRDVAGRVLSAEGEPLGGAEVRFVGKGRYAHVKKGALRTPVDGTFRFKLSLGTYFFDVVREGMAPVRKEVEVGDGGVADLVIWLSPGVTLSGRLLGFPPEELATVRVNASGNGRHLGGRVSPGGGYVVEHVGPGDWTVIARLGDNRRREARGRVTIREGVDAELDLELLPSWIVSGTVLADGSPLAGARVELTPTFKPANPSLRRNESRTDDQGFFQLADLLSGTYRVAVFADGARQYSEEVAIDADRDLWIDLRTVSLAGHVRAADDGTPVPEARLTLRRLSPEGTAPPWRQEALAGTRSDAAGAFRFERIPPGTWSLVTTRDSFAQVTQVVTPPAAGVEVTLERTEGISFEPVLASGKRPQEVQAIVLGADDQIVGQAYTRQPGPVRITTVPDGDWELLVSGQVHHMARLAITSPGDVGRVVLEEGGAVLLEVPEMEGVEGQGWVTIFDLDGKVYPPPLPGMGERWPMEGTRGGLGFVRPGVWRFTVHSPDGREWSGEATVKAGETTEVRVP